VCLMVIPLLPLLLSLIRFALLRVQRLVGFHLRSPLIRPPIL
jgi:hypothetical protein